MQRDIKLVIRHAYLQRVAQLISFFIGFDQYVVDGMKKLLSFSFQFQSASASRLSWFRGQFAWD